MSPPPPRKPSGEPPPRDVRLACRLAVVALLILGFDLSARASDGDRLLTQYMHHSWTTNEGVPQDSIQDIAQTPDGYLWIATQEGIARFDGTQFTIFDSRTTNGVVPNLTFALFVDRGGTLWAGGGDGILRYGGNGTWIKYSARQGWPGPSGKFICDDAAGNLWVGLGNDSPSEGRGLVRFRDGRSTLYTKQDGLTSNQVYQSAPGPDGALWIGTRNGLNVLRDGHFSSYGMADGLPDPSVRALLFDGQGNLWLGTKSGLVRMRDGRVTAVFTTREGLPDDNVQCIAEDKSGTLWIGTSRGLARMHQGHLEAVTLVEGLSGSSVLRVFEDRDRNLWIGLESLGLHRLRAAKFIPYGPVEGLVGESVRAIAQDRSGRMWIGTESHGVSVSRGDRFQSATPDVASVVQDARAFLHSRDGGMWTGTRDGLHRDLGGKHTTFGFADGLPSTNVRVIHEDRDGTILIGTTQGLARFDGTRFTALPLAAGAPKSIKIIHRARDGKLWIGGADGLGYLEGERYTALVKAELPDANVYAVHEDSDGTLWFTTWSQGLYRIRGRTISRIRASDGMYDDSAWSIVEDGLGFFWFGTNRGIFRVERQHLVDFANGRRNRITYVLYGTADGMRKRETNAGSPSAMRSQDGRLWFGTTGGVVAVDPRRLSINTLAPHVVIERFMSNDVVVSDRSPIFAPGNRNFEFHYVAPSLVAPERVQYRYRLEGYDDHWIEAGGRRDAFYTNIGPGKYRFWVTAANEDGVWNERGASVPFELRPHFHQTRWFLPLIAIVLMLAGVGFKVLLERLQTIRHEGLHDSLTSLPNRRLLTKRAEIALGRASRARRSMAILFLDLDGFKAVNDVLGHKMGDKVLEIVAHRFRRCIDEDDTLARIGGDEFAVLIPDLDDERPAAAIASRLIDALAAPISLPGERTVVGVSIGIAYYPVDGEDIESILQAADRAMYRAKQAGGNSYQFNAQRQKISSPSYPAA